MNRTILFLAVIIITAVSLSNLKSTEIKSNTPSINSIIIHVTYSPCYNPDWDVTVSLNGGGYIQQCSVTDGSCKCVINSAPQGYYTITVDNGQCTATEYNVYHAASGYPTDVYVDADLNCYR